jgi:NAD(P)-dependent dehydrogenase (short-subunit alcohol dehydrogenase family)
MNEAQMSWWPEMPLAVVIGVGGMGAAIARRLGQHYRLLLTDLNAERLEAVATTLRDEGCNVATTVCDITNAASVQQLAQTVSQTGPLRVLAHVAGLSPSMADWRTIMKVNLIGARLIADALLPLAQAGTAAIFIASLAAHVMTPSDAVLHVLHDPLATDFLDKLAAAHGAEMTPTLAYVFSKNELVRLCQREAWAWGQRKARIVSLSPGLIATPMGALEFKKLPAKFDMLANTPLGRQGGMLEIADAVEFLASDRASFISGIDLLVDGGLNAASRHIHKKP